MQFASPPQRSASLDYLRGLAAFGIMLFHYTMWTMGTYDASNFLGRVGIYGVVIFYMLSGITMHLVYYDAMGSPSRKGLKDFSIKRVARIFPLLWLMTILTLLIKQEDFPLPTILVNLSGLFSLYHWGETVCYGAWSIGNELVFYIFFPLFIFLSKKHRLLFTTLCLALATIYFYYTFFFMDSTKPLTAQYWIPFINPLNQVAYFLVGYLISHWAGKWKPGALLPAFVTIASILAFIFYPAKGETMVLISGFTRVAFTLICAFLCAACYLTTGRLPGILHKAFSTLGEISYGVYLSHPLVTYVLTKILKHHFPGISTPAIIASCITATLLISWMIYRFYEKPFMRIGKSLSLKLH